MIKRVILEFRLRGLIKEMDNLYVSERALEFYRECVKGNKYEDKKILIKKLKRNFVLGERVNHYTVRYGNLFIQHTNERITSIYNMKKNIGEAKIDYKLKKRLDYILELE